MKRIVLIVVFLLATGAVAQPAPPPRAPEAAPMRGDLWQRLTPEQREQLWRSLTPEQKGDLWRGLEPQERREMRERLAPNAPDAAGRPWVLRRHFDGGDGQPRMMMTPEERQQMREQIREAHRLRRERTEAERDRGRRGE